MNGQYLRRWLTLGIFKWVEEISQFNEDIKDKKAILKIAI